jgi:CubicO group peptidase (beta-lactamase class C family)
MSPLTSLDAYIEHMLESWEIPGLAVRVLKDGKVVHSKGYGVRELGKSEPVTEQTVFSIASCTKAFTATALGMLVDENKLAWDDLVIKHLPDFQTANPALTSMITLRDLLAHRVGLKENFRIETQGLDYSRQDMIRTVRYSQVTNDFRTKASYSNVMYTVVGKIIEEVSGQSWDDFLKEHIFKPLKMTSSGTSAFDLAKAGNHSSSHIRGYDGNIMVDPIDPAGYWTMDNTAPCGAITSTLEDLTPWLLAHMQRGKHKDLQLFSEKTAKEMHTPHMLVEVVEGSPFTFEAYGLGWYITQYQGQELIWHSGLFRGMFSAVVFAPLLDLGIIILGNARDGAGLMEERLMQWMIDRYLNLPKRDWVSEALAEEIKARVDYAAKLKRLHSQRLAETTPSLTFENYQGVYAFSPPDQWAVVLRGNELRLERLRTSKPYYAVLEHWHNDIFKPHWNDPLPDYAPAKFVSFHLGVDNVPLGLTFQGPFVKAEYQENYYARVADYSEAYRVTF